MFLWVVEKGFIHFENRIKSFSITPRKRQTLALAGVEGFTMRLGTLLVIAVLLVMAPCAWAQVNIGGTYIENPGGGYTMIDDGNRPYSGGGYGGNYGNGGFGGFNNGYGLSAGAQKIVAIGSVLHGLFKKSPAESQAHAQVRKAELEYNGPVAQALAAKIRFEAVSKARLTGAETARMYAGATVSDDDQVTADGGTHHVMNVSGGQVANSMSLSPDYDALGSESTGQHTVSMANRGRRRTRSSFADRIARIRERKARESETAETSEADSDDEAPAPKPVKNRHHRAKAVETPESGPPEKEAPSFGGRERPPWEPEE